MKRKTVSRKLFLSDLLIASLLASSLLTGCGQKAANSDNASETKGTTETAEAVSETASEIPTSEMASSEEEVPETLFDNPSEEISGLYQVNTDFITKDDYILQMDMLGDNLLVYTENYGGTGNNKLWLLNPYTGNVVQSVDMENTEYKVQVTENSVIAATDEKFFVFDQKLQAQGSFSPENCSIGTLKASEDGTKLYGISSDKSKILEIDPADGGEKQILSAYTSDLNEIEIIGAGDDWLFLQKRAEESFEEEDSEEEESDRQPQLWSISGNCLLAEEPVAFEKMTGNGTRSVGLASISGVSCLTIGDAAGSDLNIIVPQDKETVCITDLDSQLTTAAYCEPYFTTDFTIVGWTCRTYNLSDGTLQAEQSFASGQNGSGTFFNVEYVSMDSSRNVVFVAGFNGGYQIYAMQAGENAEAETAEPIQDCLLPLENALEGTNEDLADERELAETIGEKYGVSILLGDDVRGAYFDKCYSPILIRITLNVLNKELARYPESIFTQIRECYEENLQISLLGAMSQDSGGGTMPSELGGNASDNKINLSIREDGIGRILNHEMMHILECQVALKYMEYWENWQASSLTLPEGFTYQRNYSQPSTEYTISGAADVDHVWFVDDYGSTNGAEDMARIFEYSMMEPEAGGIRIEDYPHLKDKLRTICDNIRRSFNTEDWPETTEWEKALR